MHMKAHWLDFAKGAVDHHKLPIAPSCATHKQRMAAHKAVWMELHLVVFGVTSCQGIHQCNCGPLADPHSCATQAADPVAASKPAVSDEEIDLPSDEPEADDLQPTADLTSDTSRLHEDGVGPSDAEALEPVEGAEDQEDMTDPRHDESNIGQYSPEPLLPGQIYGQDVVSEQEDRRMLDLLRAQVGSLVLVLSHLCLALAGLHTTCSTTSAGRAVLVAASLESVCDCSEPVRSWETNLPLAVLASPRSACTLHPSGAGHSSLGLYKQSCMLRLQLPPDTKPRG